MSQFFFLQFTRRSWRSVIPLLRDAIHAVRISLLPRFGEPLCRRGDGARVEVNIVIGQQSVRKGSV